METLAERVVNFSKVKIRGNSKKKPKQSKEKAAANKPGRIVMPSSLVGILLKAAVEKAKAEGAKAEKNESAEKSGFYEKKEDEFANGGYGKTSKSYGNAIRASYVDYEKLFSYLGKFKAGNAYESEVGISSQASSAERGSFAIIDKETMEAGTRHIKYFLPAGSNLDPSTLVPIAGMSSSEWEQFRMWVKLDPVMYRLKMSTS